MAKKFLYIVVVIMFWVSAPLLLAKAPEPKTHRISIQNFVFVPAHIEVHVGDVVEWNNGDFAPHTATADNGSWNTDSIKNGGTVPVVVSVPGSITYRCVYHPGMTGVIVVKPSVKQDRTKK
jgi:plastocyanin